MRQYLTFELDDRRYGVRVEYVNSVLDPQTITPLPGGSSIVTGLTNVRGNVVPVFDPRETLRRTRVDDAAMEALASGNDEEGGIVIFEVDNGTLLPFIGIQADRIGRVINLEDADVSPVPNFLPADASRFFEGFCFVGSTRHSIINLHELASRDTLFGNSQEAYRA